MIDPNWTEVKNNSIDVPDELMPLFNKVGMQLRLHTISGRSKVTTIAHIVEQSRQFFIKHPELLTPAP